MKKFKKLLSVFLCLTMLLSTVSICASAFGERVQSTLSFFTASDIHLYPESLMGDKGEEWQKFCRLYSKMFNESEQILRTGLETMVKRAKENGAKYVLIPGDLTKDSEFEAHRTLASILGEYQEKYDIKFFVINGNHDINTTKACTFENGKKEQARAITPAEFPEIYADFGYAVALDRYAYPEKGDKVKGALSYVADLGENFRLIVVDSSSYSFDEPQKDVTGGSITPELMSWIEKWANKSKEDGKTPLMMIHHNMAPHMKVEPSISFAFVLDNYLEASEKLASLGINYVFSGHLHTNDVSSVVNDDGQVLYDFETASLTGFPNLYRENKITKKANGETSIYSNSVDFDSETKFTFDGVTYDNSSYKYKAFDLCFGGGLSKDGKANITEFLIGVVKHFADDYINDINKAGGILPFLKSMNIDIEEILVSFLKPYIGDGFKIGSYNIFSVDNLMWFIEDLLGQISDLYLKDPQKLYSLLTGIVDKLANVEIADIPCTKFIKDFGFGDEKKNGTLADALLSAMYYWDTGNEDISDDAFMQNVIDKLENGDTAERLFNKVLDLLLHDLVEDALLSKLEIRVDKLFANTELQKKMGEGINYLLNYVLRGDFTYMNLVNTVFELGVLPYNSLYDVLDKLVLKEYLTQSQFESIGLFMAYVVADFSTDENPKKFGDYNVTYTGSSAAVEASTENYRLPTMISNNLGADEQTEASINWFSKYSLDGDIEIYKADSEPAFKGKATTNADFTIEKETAQTEKSFPGIDIGIIGFFNYVFKLNRHTVTLSNLEPGATYYYRVGNEKYGWWSKTGKITTADGSDEVTFLHVTDPQSQNERQYNRAWKKVLDNAFSLYPDTDFVLSTGDLVDNGKNNKQWQYMFDCAADTLQSTYLFPTSGNHDKTGDEITKDYFALPNIPKQDNSTGVYYSFDYNNIHVVVLNTNDADKNGLSKEQTQWLTDDMNKSGAKWKFVAMHKAIYSQGSHYDDKEVVGLRTQLGELMPKLGIDLVFEGHDHVYLRTASLVNNEKVQTENVYLQKDGNVYKTLVNPSGTSYVISGTAGVKTYVQKDTSKTDKLFPRGEKVLSVDFPMFSAVRVKDDILYFDAYAVGENESTCVDRFALAKDVSKGDVVTDYEEAEEQENENDATAFFKTLFEYIVKIFKVIFNIYKMYFKQM